MRIKHHILDDMRNNINKAPKESRCLLEHEYCFIEVMIDIRDELTFIKSALEGLKRAMPDPG